MTATATATTRQYIAYPVALMETKYGDVEVTFNGGSPDTLYVHTSYGSGGRCPIIEIRGVQYSFGVHLERDGDGWKVKGNTPHEQYQYTTVSRPGPDWNKEPSRAARQTIATMAVEVANRVASMLPEFFKQAEQANLNNDLMTLERKIAEAQAALDALNAEAAEKRAREAVLASA